MLIKICLYFLNFNWASKCHNKLNSFQYIWKQVYIQKGGGGLCWLQVNPTVDKSSLGVAPGLNVFDP